MRKIVSATVALALVSVCFSVGFSDNAEAAFIESVAVPWDSSFIPNDSAWDSSGNYCLVVGDDTDATADENAWVYSSLNGNWTKVEGGEAPTPKAATYFVGSGAGNQSTTIQAAINMASAGDTVYVWPGTYYENVVVNKAINLTGHKKLTTIIDANFAGNTLTIMADFVNVQGFTITHSGFLSMGVYINGARDCKLNFCIIKENYGGVYLFGADSNTIGSNNITDNDDHGVFLNYESDDNLIRLNDIHYNNYGIYIDSSDSSKIYHNNIIGNTNQAYDSGTNTWYKQLSGSGNFWSDWTSPDVDGNGIVDSPHLITGGAQDPFPHTMADAWTLPRGVGTVEDPFMVYDVWQLQAMKNNLTAHYALANDIGAGITSGWNSGAGFEPVGFTGPTYFTGSLDGRGHVITGLKISRSSTNYAVGLFGAMDVGSAVFNLGMVSADIRGGTYGTAALAGYCVGTVSRCYSTGAIVGTSFAYSGGLIGSLASGGSVTDSYSTASVTGGTDLGGFVGRAWGYVARCYSTGNVGTGTNRGGFAGYNYDTIANCFWDTQTSGMMVGIGGGTNVGATGKTTAEMKAQATFVGWDFSNVWSIQEGVTYPQLRAPQFMGGIGTPDSPYLIFDVDDLQAVQNLLGASYRLGADIDASATSGWNGGAGFVPLGAAGSPFTGSFDGADHTISGLHVNLPATFYVGLFGRMDSPASVSNVTLADADIAGNSYTGALVGYNNGGKVANSSSSGFVSGSGLVGGLVGYNSGGIVTCSYSTADVQGSGEDIGGLVGYTDWLSFVTFSYATGYISGDDGVGGLVGENCQGTIHNCYATGEVSGNNDVGGLVGLNMLPEASILKSYSTGPVTGMTSPGGLVGWSSGIVSDSYWDTDTSGLAVSAGGIGMTTTQIMLQSNLAGWDFANVWWSVNRETRPFLRMEWSEEIRNGHQVQMMSMNLNANYILACDIDLSEITEPAQMWGTSMSSGNGFMPVGQSAMLMFKGSLEGNGHSIDNLYIHRTTDYIGLFGYIDTIGSVFNVAMNQVSVYGKLAVGGLVGRTYGTVSSVGVSGSVTGTGYNVGGITGYNDGTITGCVNSATVTGLANNGGGIVGYCSGPVTKSLSTGDVSAVNYAGGIVGYLNNVNIDNCYAWGDVSGSLGVGGFVGHHYGTVTNSYSTGHVADVTNAGGFTGYKFGGNAIGCYWDVETSGMATSPAGTGLTTAQMKTQAQFTSVGWDFVNIWHMLETVTYPLFQWQPLSSGSAGEPFTALRGATYDPATNRFLTCGEHNGNSSVFYIMPNNLSVIVPVPDCPAHSFTAIACDNLGNFLVGGSSLPGLYYFDRVGVTWYAVAESGLGSMADWNVTGITFNQNDGRFYIVGNVKNLGKGVAFFTDIAPLNWVGAQCYRDMSDFMNAPGPDGLSSVGWNQLHDYGLAVGDGVYRVNSYDGNVGNELTWSVIASAHPDNQYLDISWDSDGWNEAGIVGRNQTYGNYWRYYDTNPQLIQGHRDPAAGTKYRTCAMKPPSSPKWLFIPHSGGGIRVGIMEKDESGVIQVDVNFPHIFTVDMWKQNDPARVSRLDSQVEVDSTYTFFIEGNYTRAGINYWNSLEVELAAWFDFGNLASDPADPAWSLGNHRTSQFNVSYNGPSGNMNVNYPLPAAPAGEEFSMHSYWQDPTNYGADGNTRRLYINVTFGPQTIMATGQGPMSPPGNTWDKNIALNDRFTWDFRVLMYDTSSTTARNISFNEFGVQRYASLSVSGNPAASIPPGATAQLATPSVLAYSSNAQYKLNVSIPHLYLNGNPLLNFITVGNVRVLNNHTNANAANSNISAWQQFLGENNAQIVWGTESSWIQPVGSGTVSAGPMYSDYTAVMVPETFEVTRVWWEIHVPAGTPEGVYRGTITVSISA